MRLVAVSVLQYTGDYMVMLRRGLIFSLAFLSLPLVALASQTSGTIDATSHSALVCHDVSCSSPTPGTINFLPTGATAITITDTSIDGMAWGNELGWITMNPTGAAGVVVNPTTGALTGMAWSQVSGWINFNPTGQGVTINSSGQLTGYAWTGGVFGGWIKFDCASASTCVKTDWRPISARTTTTTTTGGGGGGGNGPISGSFGTIGGGGGGNGQPANDMCVNLPGVQSSVPSGYSQDQGGICSLLVDYCQNIAGIQYGVPTGYSVDPGGDCVSSVQFDMCPGTPGVQFTASECSTPAKTKPKTTNAQTTPPPPPPYDACANLSGIQATVPDGYQTDGFGACVPVATDYCPNIAGNQTTIPDGMIIGLDGSCVSQLPQPQVPDQTNNTNAGTGGTTGGAQGGTGTSKDDIISYSFVPSAIRVPLTSPFFANVARGEGKVLGFTMDNDDNTQTQRVDMLSLLLTIFVPLFLLVFITRRVWKLATAL